MKNEKSKKRKKYCDQNYYTYINIINHSNEGRGANKSAGLNICKQIQLICILVFHFTHM